MALSAVVFSGAATIVFGPRTYQRGTGQPVAVTSTFQVASPSNPYMLRAVNKGVTSGVISLNGHQVLGPSDFSGALLERSVTLLSGANQISVELRGKPGTSLTLEIDGSTTGDTTPPTITAAVSPLPNAAGWNNANVTVTFTCADAGSGIATCPAPVVVSTEGANQVVSGKAVDKAGNSATATVTVKIDKTPPVVTASRSPAPAPNGWNTGPVVVTFAATDTLSGVAACTLTTPVTLTTDGANLSASGHATDVAGNVGSFTFAPIKIDQTNPSINVALTPPNANGWNNGPVTAHFTCADATSGIAACPPDQVITSGGAGQTVSGTTTDNAGHTASVTSAAFSIDQTKPTVTVELVGATFQNGWFNGPVTAHFTCVDSGSGIDVCPVDQVVSAEGTRTVSGTASDKAGNTASATSDPIKIDLGPPTITAHVSPTPNANGWNNSPVTVHYECTDGGAGLASCPADQIVTDDTVAQSLSGTAVDQAGNTATAFATVNLDRTPPVLTFTSPVNGTTLFTPTVTAIGTVTDSLSGVAAVTCGVLPASVSNSNVSCTLTLGPGPNSFAAIAADVAGNSSAPVTLGLNYTHVPVVKILQPSNLSYLSMSPTTVSGTVDDPDAQVTINSIPVPKGGSFSIALPLAEGPNVITASAASDFGAVGTASVEVTLDTTPPRVNITSPPDQFVTTEASISVSGNVNDIVVGTVNDEQAHVTVNGANAQVANRTFLATNVPLAIGPNTISVVGTDRAGNSSSPTPLNQITVTRRALTAPQIKLISGNNQAGAIGSTLAQPLVVAITDAAGNPVPNKPVVFKVTQNDGLIVADAAPGPSVITTTDGGGLARARWTLGNRAGAGGNSVEAYSVGFESVALFTATGTQSTPGKIVVDTGNDQIGAIGQQLPKPFIAVVVDAGNNRLGGVPVIFSVVQGGGSFEVGDQHQTSVQVETDSDGRAAATLTLGTQEGNANNFVQATFPSNQGFAASFSASGRAPGNVVDTTISGVVLDNSNMPVPGVTLRAVLTDVLHSNANSVQTATPSTTDDQGQFSIAQAPVGLVKLIVDGHPPYPALEYDMVTIAGQVNTVGSPIYLLAVSDVNKLCVTATSGGGTLTIPEAPGFSLTFGPNQVTFPGGSKSGCVTVTTVHGDKVPMVPGFGQQPRFIVTIQPAGAVFNPPAPITLPNVDGLKPRQVTEMYSFDHDIGSFVAIGTGIVSDDGQIIRTSPGVGVLKAGWHCGGDPSTTGSAADCGACQTCLTDHCEADPGQNGQTLPDDKCKVCDNGSPKDIPLNELGVELAYTFGPPVPAVDKFNEALDVLKNIGVIAKVTPLTITGKISEKECCDPENGTGKGKETSGSVSGNFGGFEVKGKLWPPGPIPSISIKIDAFGLASLEAKAEFVGGIFLGLTGKVEGEIGYKKKDCSKDPEDRAGCVFAGLNIKLTPSLSAEIGGSASLTYDCFFCDKTTIEVEGSLIFGELSWPIDVAGVSYNKESCSAGVTGGFLQAGKGEFKVAAKFKGSYKTNDTGSRSVELTLDFLKCEFTTSSAECHTVF